MRLLVLAPLLLAACTASDGPPPAADPTSSAPVAAASDDFDGAAWLAEARAADAPLDSLDYTEETYDRMRDLTARLGEVADWQRTCDTFTDYETGETVYEPVADGEGHWVRGTLRVSPALPQGGGLVAVTCDFGAYQGYYALVHVTDDRAAILEAPVLDSLYTPTARTSGQYSAPDFDAANGTFTTTGLARGLGDCGEFVRYRVTGFGTVEIAEVRVQDCDYDGAPNVEPTTWPVVYPR